ncbi:MAG TPA: ACT domain-containing protein, partial [Gemmatimonadales bacterium]|nr:ACT domain-containing protein [Gemmatimonadales bacterium]
MTAGPIRAPARWEAAIVLLALLIACGRSSRDEGPTLSRDSAARAAQADTARWADQRRRQDSEAVITHARLTPLSVLPDRYAVCRLSRRDRVPSWATTSSRGISSITRTADELSIIALDSVAPRNIRCERNWRVIKVRGPLPFDLIGVISGISGALADAGISIFAFSTFDTDYVMVKEGHLDAAVNALHRAQYPILGPPLRDSTLPLTVKPVDEG